MPNRSYSQNSCRLSGVSGELHVRAHHSWMVRVGGILPLFNRQAGKDGPKIYLCVGMIFFLIWQSCPSTLKLLPFLYYLKTSRIATLKSNAKLTIFLLLFLHVWFLGVLDFFLKGKTDLFSALSKASTNPLLLPSSWAINLGGGVATAETDTPFDEELWRNCDKQVCSACDKVFQTCWAVLVNEAVMKEKPLCHSRPAS